MRYFPFQGDFQQGGTFLPRNVGSLWNSWCKTIPAALSTRYTGTKIVPESFGIRKESSAELLASQAFRTRRKLQQLHNPSPCSQMMAMDFLCVFTACLKCAASACNTWAASVQLCVLVCAHLSYTRHRSAGITKISPSF